MMKGRLSRSLSNMLDSYMTVSAEDLGTLTDERVGLQWLRGRKTDLLRGFFKEFAKNNVAIRTANGWPIGASSVQDAMSSLALEIRTSVSEGMEPVWIYIG